MSPRPIGLPDPMSENVAKALILCCVSLVISAALLYVLLEAAERDRDSARESMLQARLKLAAVQRAVAT